MKTINKKTLSTSVVLLAMVFGATSVSALSFGDFTFFGGSNTKAESSASLRADAGVQATSTNSRDQASTMLNASVDANGKANAEEDENTATSTTNINSSTELDGNEDASFFTRIGLWFKSVFSFNSDTDSAVDSR